MKARLAVTLLLMSRVQDLTTTTPYPKIFRVRSTYDLLYLLRLLSGFKEKTERMKTF